jgi:hypothetical protein
MSDLCIASASGLGQKERTKYEKMWRLDQYRTSSPDEAYLPTIRKWLAPRSEVIVFGCGPGRAGLALAKEGHAVAMVDIADNCLDPGVAAAVAAGTLRFARGCLTEATRLVAPADWGICCDVLEHLPPEWVVEALEQMRALVPRIFISISHVPDACGRWINDTLHLTVAPLEWWLPHLSRLWPRMGVGCAGGSVSTLYCEATRHD